MGFAIDPQSLISAGSQMPPSIARFRGRFHVDRRHQQDAAPLRHRQHLVDDLIRRLRPHRCAAFRAMHHAQSRDQDAEVIVNLGDRTDGASRRMPDVLLLQRHRGGQAFDPLDHGLLRLADELTGVGRQRFDIPALPLGIDGVHRQRRLAAAAGAAKHRHRVAGDRQIDMLQVVLRGTLNRQPFGRVDHRSVGLFSGPSGLRLGPRPHADPIRSVRGQLLRQRRARKTPLGLRDLLRRPLGNDLTATLATQRPQIDHPVGRLDDVQIVLDDQDRVAAIGQTMQHAEQQFDIGEVQPGGRFVEDVQRPPGRLAAQFPRQLDPLGLAARERGRRLA